MLITTIAIGTGPRENAQLETGATGATIYDYYSSTDSGLSAAVSTQANWVLTDSNATANKFTLNIGSNAYAAPVNTVWLGSTSNNVLTGSSAGQFLYGSPNLKSLATTTNLTTITRLYGFRTNTNIDLTNYKDVTVTFGWDAGGSGSSFTGFLARSTANATSESWSVMGTVKRSMNLSNAGSLSFTDTTNTVLMGQSMSRFALIFGSSTQARALKNIYITITANLRTSLDSVNNPFFNHTGNYVTGGTMNFHEFYFTANYSYRIGGNTVTIYGDTANVSLSLESHFDPLLTNGGTIPAAGTHTLYYKYFDSSIDPTGVNAKSNSVVFVIDPLPLTHTDIYAVDAVNYTLNPLYEYDTYQPQLTVTPLYNDETTPRIDEPPLGSGLYTTSLAAGTMLTASTTNVVTCSHAFTATLNVSVNTTRTSTGISLSGQKTAFLTGETFSIDTLVVTGNWSAGSATTPSYASTQTDGKYTVSKTIGEALITAGTQTITVSYYVNEVNVTTTYDITISRTTYTFFNHSFSAGGEWGATTTPVYGAITNLDGNLTNSVYGWTSSTTWVLNTTATDATGPNGAFYSTVDPDLGTNHLRFGTSATTNGPTTVRMEGKNFPAITNPENTLNGISRITIDAHTGVADSLTVSVAGIAPTSYALNYGTPTAGSTATTIANDYTYYTFYFPFLVIGKIRMNFTNGATPGFFDIGNFSIIGENLTLSEQTGVFANMLNNTSSCSVSNYDNLKIVYDYLSSKSAVSDLSSITMTNHTGTPSAADLWAIMVTRKATDKFTLPVNPETILPIFEGIKFYLLIIGVLGVSIAAYFFTIARKKRTTI